MKNILMILNYVREHWLLIVISVGFCFYSFQRWSNEMNIHSNFWRNFFFASLIFFVLIHTYLITSENSSNNKLFAQSISSKKTEMSIEGFNNAIC